MLTDTKIQKLKSREKPYREVDQNGLYLLIEPNGIKKWQFRFTWKVDGKKKRPWQSLGQYPYVSLKRARELVTESKVLLAQNINPIEYKKELLKKVEENEASIISNQMTFGELFETWHKHNADSWEYEHAKDIWNRINNHLLPSLSKCCLDDIKPMDMINALKKIEQKGYIETTRRVKQYANRIFKFGIGFGYCERNPASDLPEDIFKKNKSVNYPHVIESKALKQVLLAIDSYHGDVVTLKALQMQPHVFLRSVELAGIRWEEIDLHNRLIQIPADRMKKNRAHIVPITDQVLDIIDFMKPISEHSDFLFPSPRTIKRPINEQSLNSALHRLGLKGVQSFHGFRHTASTLLNEMGFHGDFIEKQLAHEESNKVRKVYNKAEYLVKRQDMMQKWSLFLDSIKSSH